MTNDHASNFPSTEPTREPKSIVHKRDGPKGKIKRKRKSIGFSEQMEMKRHERANKPRTWIERKLVVPFVIGIVGYAWYVYIGRFCVPMIRQDEDAMGGKGMGVAFTIVFCLLGLMFWWTYIKLLFTHPGFARDFVQKTSAPRGEYHAYGRPAPSASRSRSHEHGLESDDPHSDDDVDFIGGTPYAEISPSPSSPPSNEEPPSKQHNPIDVEKHAELGVPAAPRRPSAHVSRNPSAPVRKLSKKQTPVQIHEKHDMSHSHARTDRHISGIGRNTDETAVASAENDTRTAPPHPLAKRADPRSRDHTHHTEESRHPQQPPRSPRNMEDGLPPPIYSRRPPTHPALLPEYRYCSADELVKPMRAHHCRVCGTCVLMYDHHCPWIGQCVGAFNHKFFVNFLVWSTPWTLWIFATLVGLQVKTGRDIDPQIIVIIALSAFFSLFTSVLLAAHIHMIIHNQTSVESLSFSSMRERERTILGRMVPLCDWRRRNAIRKDWDHEWGKLNTEGNIWWLGSARANWEYRMGRSWTGWILPIGKSEGDGLTYPTNPRFDKDGRWRRRNEWPSELQ